MSMSRLSAVVFVVAALAGSSACSTLRSIASDATQSNSKAKAKSRTQKEIAACEKMCSVAGDVDAKEGAVSDCKKECRN